MSHECFADEIAIDFPSVERVVERMRDRFLGERADADVLSAEVSVTKAEASTGLVVPLELPVRTTCRRCGGRGETWTEPCHECCATGESLLRHSVRVAVPAGVADGARFRFRLSSPDLSPVCVELRVLVRQAAF